MILQVYSKTFQLNCLKKSWYYHSNIPRKVYPCYLKTEPYYRKQERESSEHIIMECSVHYQQRKFCFNKVEISSYFYCSFAEKETRTFLQSSSFPLTK